MQSSVGGRNSAGWSLNSDIAPSFFPFFLIVPVCGRVDKKEKDGEAAKISDTAVGVK